MSDDLRAAFIRRMTVDSPHHDRRRKDYNQAIFMDNGASAYSDTTADMVLDCFDAAVKDVGK